MQELPAGKFLGALAVLRHQPTSAPHLSRSLFTSRNARYWRMDIRCGAQISEALWGTERPKFQAERLNPLRAAGHVAYHRGRADVPYLHIAYKFLNSS
jgi:hypothetical protein